MRGDFGDDDPTIIEDPTVIEFRDEQTPDVPPRCRECGEISFTDDAASVTFPDDRCLHSLGTFDTGFGIVPRWHWCRNLRKSVSYVPR